ncbi:MAG: TVP38/TMEM64 family protein [Erysipelotrichaceae bacterium]
MNKTMKQFMRTYFFPLVGVLFLATLLWPILSTLIPELLTIIKSGQMSDLEAYFRSFGVLGIVAVILIQILQVIVVILPSPVVWIPAGIVFGTFPGLLYCLIGLTIGNGLVFITARKLGIGSKSTLGTKAMSALDRIKSPDLVLFLICTLPGMPNGIIPYVYAQSKFKLTRYLLIVIAGSIPSILMSTYIGDALISGKYLQAAIMMILIGLALGSIVWKKEAILTWIEKFERTH